MTPEQFAYWLQGFAEMNPEWSPTPEQWKMIKEHLQTVFKKVTPSLTQTPWNIQPQIQPINPLAPYQSIPGQSPYTVTC